MKRQIAINKQMRLPLSRDIQVTSTKVSYYDCHGQELDGKDGTVFLITILGLPK